VDSSVSRRRLAAAAGGLLVAAGVHRPAVAQSDPTPQLPVILASDFGPVGDGETDDSAALQSALDQAEQQGGGLVLIGPGIFRCNLIIGSQTTIQGAGHRTTTLMAVAGSNRPVIEGRGFAELTGTLTEYPERRGANYIGLSMLTVDGARATNTSGAGIQIWGRSHVFRDLIVQNCAEDGISLEFTTHGQGDSIEDNVEGFFTNIKTILNGGNGWRHRGPHDSVLSNFVTFSNDGWGFISEGTPDGYNGGISGSGWNSWLNGLGSFHFGVSPGYLSDSAATGPNLGIGIELAATAGSSRMSGILISGHETGLVLRGGNHIFSGVILNSTSSTEGWPGTGILIDNAGLCVLDVTGSQNERAIAVDFEWGPNIIRGRFNVPANGILLSGFVQPQTTLDLARIGADGSETIVQIPGVHQYVPAPPVPQADSPVDPVVTTETGAAEVEGTAELSEAGATSPAVPGETPLPSQAASVTPSPVPSMSTDLD
jgi:hypothetical protein